MGNLRTIANTYNCCILVIHHARKREGKERRIRLDQSDLIGSSIMTRVAGLVMAIDKIDTNDGTVQGIIRVAKSWLKNFTPLKFTLEDKNDGNISLTFAEYEGAETKPMKAQTAICEYIKTHNSNKFTRQQVVEALAPEGIKETAIKQALSNMKELGLLGAEGKTKDRKYFVIPLF